MANVTFEKDLYVRDKYNVRRRAFLAGDTVEGYIYEAVLRNNTVVNKEDMPEYKGTGGQQSLHKDGMETKALEAQKPKEAAGDEPAEKAAPKEEAEAEQPEESAPAKTKKGKSK